METGKIEYNGEWCEDNPHGYGIQTLENGESYEGQFVHGLR